MQVLSSRSFSAKLLLFGEYSILFDSKAVVLPLKEYSGKLVCKDTLNALESGSHRELWWLYSYLLEQKIECLDLNAFKRDLQKGMWFDSNIPQGYGIGSSGALTAAVFYQYVNKEILNEVMEKNNYSIGREILGKMESHFHDKSSGLDPLSSLIDRPMLVENGEVKIIQVKDIDTWPEVSLVNTQKSRQVRKIMQKFTELCANPDFVQKIKEDYLDINNLCVESYLKEDKSKLKGHLRELSQFQLEYFRDFIPDNMIEEWRSALKRQKVFFKLCGAGGGGHLLRFSCS